MNEIVIWAQSVCRSTMALYREVKRQSKCPVTVIVRLNACGEAVRVVREAQGQDESAYADVVDQYWDGDYLTGRAIIGEHSKAIHVFSGYQVSSAVSRLIGDAHASGLRTIVYDEAPCEMCVGVKALLKRLCYRLLLPCKVRSVTKAADLFLCASGRKGLGRLKRLGWSKERIVPFGYASAVSCSFTARANKEGNSKPLRVLHTGVETPYRDVETLLRAERVLKRQGVKLEVVRTHGTLPAGEMERLYKWADVFVACGLCEPWGMRVNDAIHAGLPVMVSSGMGAKWLVEQFGCGCVYEKGDVAELADILQRFATDSVFRSRLLSGVRSAHEAWTPKARAKVLLDVLKA